ncbi:hypothetical protein GH714_008036 [Hevea brasiliensis]|uniref:Protein FAR1-RELATED SEQUENCE n=1 Tax=Hevea brasiliensis TaxID=3981 RepID=A0A6A6LIZ7_HEVBR|nr:hypothetical protein GH714_008036 [Hevea brasiliensis]
MDVHVIDEDVGMGHRVMVYDGDAEPNEGEEAEHSSAHDNDGTAEPHVGMEFHSEDAAKTFYDEYARRRGFSSKVVHFNRSKADGTVIFHEFVCSREGSKRRSADSCDAMLRIELKSQNKWVVTKFIKEHGHSMVSPGKVHYLRPRRHFAGATKSIAKTYQAEGIVPSGVMYASMDGNHISAEANRGLRNAPSSEPNRATKNAATLSYAAENPGFFYAIQLDDDNHMANVFWADARSRTAYGHFGDAVTLDTNYRINQYRVPIAPFSGVNHHGQTILFGCAILLDDSEASIVWLFKTFLAAMNNQQPVSIITDQHRAIQTAVSQVELYNCINLTETIEEFESSWSSILDKYDLGGHDWLQSLYNTRAQWVPVYFRDSFLL